MVKTGSQVLDSICISEAEKQAVLTLIREEVHTLIRLSQTEVQFALSVCDAARLDLSSALRMSSFSSQNTSLFRSSLKRWRPTTGRRSMRSADRKSLR